MRSATALFDSIDRAAKEPLPLGRFLFALGLPGLGDGSAETVAHEFGGDFDGLWAVVCCAADSSLTLDDAVSGGSAIADLDVGAGAGGAAGSWGGDQASGARAWQRLWRASHHRRSLSKS